MTRPYAAIVSALVVLVLVACDRRAAADDRPAASRAAPASAGAAAPADAAHPNQVLDEARFADPQTRAAYAAARQYAHVLEGIYCYCHCRENIGHRALVECFETDHATQCDICQMEAVVAARMAAEGRPVGEIQQAIDAYYKQG